MDQTADSLRECACATQHGIVNARNEILEGALSYARPALAMSPEQLVRLVTWVMPYGKYKGRLIADLPGNYLNWFARKGFPPGELGELLALMQELDHNGLSTLLDPLRRPPD